MKKKIVKLISYLFPGPVVNFAYNQLTNPQIKKLRTHELETLEKAEKESLDFKGFQIQTYCWRGGDKEVMLVHGWEGQAGNFSDLVNRLLSVGYTIRAFDGPSHGFSSKGRTSLFEFTELVGVLIRKYKAKNLISHSFGGVATTYALYANKDLSIDKYVLLTTPDRFVERIEDVSKMTGITKKVKDKLITRLEKELSVDVSVLNVSDFVQDAKVDSALIIHDKDDKVIPINRSKNVHKNWKASKFEEITGTGHFRILRTEKVHDLVIDFLD
ncbi:MAG: alpha/beta hydrolase [Cyclobacteriaceae bacterium]